VAGTSGAVADKQRHLEQMSECALAMCQMVVEECMRPLRHARPIRSNTSEARFRGLHVRRESVGAAPRSTAILCRPAPNPIRPIRDFHVRCIDGA
jgi:hypothetical protein